MYTPEALIDLHERGHRNLSNLLAHCRQLDTSELDREMPGFGYPTVRLQLHHAIGGERYWIGVLEGRIDADEDAPDYSTIEALERFQDAVIATTRAYLQGASEQELNTPRSMMTWGGTEDVFTPAHVFVRTFAHLYHHMGQVAAICRLLGKPCEGLDFPLR